MKHWLPCAKTQWGIMWQGIGEGQDTVRLLPKGNLTHTLPAAEAPGKDSIPSGEALRECQFGILLDCLPGLATAVFIWLQCGVLCCRLDLAIFLYAIVGHDSFFSQLLLASEKSKCKCFE